MDLPKILFMILVVVASVFMVVPKGRTLATPAAAVAEGFETMTLPPGVGISTTSLFASTTDDATFEKELYARRDVIDDRDDLLHARDCYQLPPDGVNRLRDGFKRAGVLYSELSMLTFSGDEIKTKIAQDILDKQKLIRGNKIRGPIYVFLTQAPFYRDPAGREMTIQFTINDYLLKPYNLMKQTEPGEAPPPIFVTAFVVYTAYDHKRRQYKRPINLYDLSVRLPNSARYTALRTYRRRDRMCQIECPKTAAEYPFYCGCSTGTKPYASSCLGPTTGAARNVDKVKKATFVFGYVANGTYPLFLKNNTIVCS